MPIYEFRCADCGHIQEFLLTRSDEQVEMKCAECKSEDLERVLSQVSYSMGSDSSGSAPSPGSSPSATTRTCAPGKSCTTLTLPGHSK